MANVEYKGHLLSTNSRAYEILTKDKDEKALGKHLKESAARAKELLTMYDRFENPITLTVEAVDGESEEIKHVVYSPYLIEKHPYIKELIELRGQDYDEVRLHVGTMTDREESPVHLSIIGTDKFPDGDKTTTMFICWLEWKNSNQSLFDAVSRVIPNA